MCWIRDLRSRDFLAMWIPLAFTVVVGWFFAGDDALVVLKLESYLSFSRSSSPSFDFIGLIITVLCMNEFSYSEHLKISKIINLYSSNL